MTGIINNIGYASWSYFGDLVWMVSPAVSWIDTVLHNPYYLAVILALLLLSLVPWTEN